MIRAMLIDLNPDELHYYPFVVSLDRSDGSCINVEDSFGRICIPNKMEGVNLKVFNIIIGINESKALVKHIPCECRC